MLKRPDACCRSERNMEIEGFPTPMLGAAWTVASKRQRFRVQFIEMETNQKGARRDCQGIFQNHAEV